MHKIRIPAITNHPPQTAGRVYAVHIFFTPEVMQYYITHDGRLRTEESNITYRTMTAVPGEYMISDWYMKMSSDHNIYVRVYKDTQWHPTGFNYIGWGVVGDTHMLVK